MSVCVLAPNGRRQTVKCSPNMTILQIIEEVCKKQGLKPDEYDIKHHNKVLDTTATFRFSGLPNNAQLELVNAVKARSNSDITLALQLEDGSRLMGNFSPSETLLSVLNKLCPDEVQKNPIIIYTRCEIYGDALQETTLKSMGLTGGRAMLRLLNRSPEQLKSQANISAPLPSKPVEEKPYKRTLVRSESPTGTPENNEVNSINKEINNDEKQTDNLDKIENKVPEAKKATPVLKNQVDLIKLAKEKRKSTDSPNRLDEKRKSIDNSSKNAVQEDTNTVCDCKGDTSTCTKTCKAFCSKPPEKPIEEEFIFLGKRNAMLFSQETAEAVPSEDLPDDFFDLTIDDARKILRDVKKRRFEMENAMLKTSALRNLEESKKQMRLLNQYKKAIIRIQFPDRTVLQGTFTPTDTVGEVMDFVREYLENKALDFYLFICPPKSILDKESRLVENGCVPGAVLYFGCNQEVNGSQLLRKDLRNKFTTNSVASLAASRMRQEATRNCGLSNMDDENFDVAYQDINNGASTSAAIPEPEYNGRKIEEPTNVPKWFKPSK